MLIAALRTDAIMYYHVYADLVTLAKSVELDKSALDMRKHYLELKNFLEEMEVHPEIATENGHEVFISERRLYGPNKKTNHRNHKVCITVQERLFQKDD